MGNKSISIVLYSLMVFSSSMLLARSGSVVICTRWLPQCSFHIHIRSADVLGACNLATPPYWGLHSKRNYIFGNSISSDIFRNFEAVSCCQTLASSQNPFNRFMSTEHEALKMSSLGLSQRHTSYVLNIDLSFLPPEPFPHSQFLHMSHCLFTIFTP